MKILIVGAILMFGNSGLKIQDIIDKVITKEVITLLIALIVITIFIIVIVKLVKDLVSTEKAFEGEKNTKAVNADSEKDSGELKKRHKVKKLVTSDKMLASTLRRLGIVILCIIVAIFVLEAYGVQIGSFVAGLGILSAIIGLALQDLLKDIIMGFHILSSRFFEIGDVVLYGKFEGEVVKFSLITTKLRNINDKSEITICNRNITEIIKVSTQVDIDLQLSYDEDIKQVHQLLSATCEEIAKIDGIDSAIYKGTNSFEESAAIYKIRFFCDPTNKPDMRRAALSVIQNKLEAAHIHIPYNQIDVHQK